MGVKWMNAAAAATSYPTDGKGGVTATVGSSGFVLQWDNRMAVLYELVVQPGSATTTCALTSHDGTTDVYQTLTFAANSAPVSIDLNGLEFHGIKIVMAGAAGTATLKFDTGGINESY